MTGARRALEGRVVLVLGAGDRVAQAVALHLSALGASLVVAGPQAPAVLVTAGLVASSRGTARVVEEPAPPLGGRDLVARAGSLLAAPTDAVVAAGAFPSAGAAEAAAGDLAAALRPGAVVVVAEASPRAGARAHAGDVARRFLGGRGDTASAGGRAR